ncbi:MAG: glycosyltransferase family 4 protein [bacterium]|nr:glycosyltransferase family 4 protein [bacterium]
MNRKKVLFLITKATWGGAQRYVFDLATHLDATKYEIRVAYGTSGKLSGDLEKVGIKTYQIPSLGRDIALFSDVSSFIQIIRCIKEVRPDVLHLNSSKAGALGALAGRLCGVPRIVFTVHGWPFKEDRNVFAWVFIRFISWLTAVLSHGVIVVSKTDENIGSEMSLIAGKIRYIPNGIDTTQFLSRENASDALSISSAPPRIVTIAELTPNKGLLYAIEAVALLKERGTNVSYFVIGDGKELQRIEELVRERGITDRVHLLGFLENAAQYLKAFDIFLLPSIKEGMPYVLLEAAMAGLPIVATDVVKAEASNLPNTYFVPPGNGKALTNEIEKLALNMPIKTAFKIQSFANMLEKTLSLY